MSGLLLRFVPFAIFAIIAFSLQFTFWAGDNSIATLKATQQTITEEIDRNNQLVRKNNVLKAEVLNLRQGDEAMEERARSEHGLVREGEIFYKIVDLN